VLDASEIAPGLWVGAAPEPGHYGARFDTLVLVASDYQPPDEAFPGVRVRRFPFGDNLQPTERDLMTAWAAATAVANDLVSGRRVLVTCRMGINRSALVAALALHMVTGMSGERAAAIVRLRRRTREGFHALSNPAFRAFLKKIR
jgi:protein-tyrosine phosphatase